MEIKNKLKYLNAITLKLNIPSDNILHTVYFPQTNEFVANPTRTGARIFFHYKNYIELICKYIRESKDFKSLLLFLDQSSEVVQDIIREMTFNPRSLYSEPQPSINKESLKAKLEKLKAKQKVAVQLNEGETQELSELQEAIASYEQHAQGNNERNLAFENFILNHWGNILDETFPYIQDIVIESPANELIAGELIEESSEGGIIAEFTHHVRVIITFVYNRLFVHPQAAVHLENDGAQDEVFITQEGSLTEPVFAGHLPAIFEGGCG